MTDTVYTANKFHLGDNLVFLHLLRALAKKSVSRAFVHFCNGCNIPQLQEAVADIPNILLEPFESPLWQQHEGEAINTWKNSEDAWVNSPLRWDWSAYALWHHGVVARQMGYESPFTCREHLLLDYPKLIPMRMLDASGGCGSEKEIAPLNWDFMVLACEPCSGQFKPMAQHGSGYMIPLIDALAKRWSVLTDYQCRTAGLTISEIGEHSLRCRNHIMIATGPMWPTLNTTNHHNHEGRRRIVLLDNGEQLNMPHIEQVANVEEVFDIARQEGWL